MAREYLMTFLNRLTNVVKSNLNAWLDSAEDPKKMINQAIVDIQEQERRAKKVLASLLGQLKLAQKKTGNSEIISMLNEQISKLKQALVQLSEKIIYMKDKGNKLIAKAAKRVTQKTASQTRTSAKTEILSGEESFNTYDRMVEKIENQEAEAWDYEELAKLETNAADQTNINLDELKTEIASNLTQAQNVARQAEQIEEELANLKNKVKLNS